MWYGDRLLRKARHRLKCLIIPVNNLVIEKMLKDIVFVEPLENHQLLLRFENGVEGILIFS